MQQSRKAPTPRRCDILIRDAMLIDGTGAPRRRADVAVSGERIAAVGDLGDAVGVTEVDAGGRIVAPGFIDVHTHDDYALLCPGGMAPKMSQGVTSVVAGNCGISLAPLRLRGRPPPPLDLLGDGEGFRFEAFAAYVDALEATPPATNAALLVGHITLRLGAMDDTERAASDAEVARMQEGVGEAMRAGAIGFSTGLDYPQSSECATEEVVALAGVAAEHGGIYASHTRDYFERVEEALDEAFEIGRQACAPLVLSHHQVSGATNFGKSRRTLARIEAARREQLVGLDAYPYAASSKVLDPQRCQPGVRVMITWSVPHPETAGRDVDDIAREWSCSSREAAERLLPAGAVYFQLDEADVRRILAYRHTMIGSDGLPHDAHPHPRLWGAFARVLGHYVRDEALLGLEEAVHRMTGLPAACYGLVERGVLTPGNHADLVLFDADTVRDTATFEKPIRAAAGIELVMVNGETVWRGGAPTGARPGRVLRAREGPVSP